MENEEMRKLFDLFDANGYKVTAIYDQLGKFHIEVEKPGDEQSDEN